MIELYDIVEAASKQLKEGTLVLHKSVKEHTKFKVYKIFSYNLYHINGKNKILKSTLEITKNCPSDEIISVWSKCDIIYLGELIKWISSKEYKDVING